MTKAAKIKILKVLKAFAGALPDAGIKSFVRSFVTSTLAEQRLSDRETMKLIKALRSIDAVAIEELRDFAKEIFDDAIKEVEAQDDEARD
ncbi:MAG: hypothetical protein IKP64_02675 [Selenomonadaceae bacterium]|nr:hypothetical protein [Selenomonadaceae bacterium]MBR4382442.1 hypothetical protein [Selenomonadaceae bacterium]